MMSSIKLTPDEYYPPNRTADKNTNRGNDNPKTNKNPDPRFAPGVWREPPTHIIDDETPEATPRPPTYLLPRSSSGEEVLISFPGHVPEGDRRQAPGPARQAAVAPSVHVNLPGDRTNPNPTGGAHDFPENGFGFPIHPSLPPVFAESLQMKFQKNPNDQDAVRWYLESLAKSDVQGGASHEQPDLEQVLRNDAKPNMEGNVAQWVPIKCLGAGTYGEVVLWERDLANCGPPARVACKEARFDEWFQDYSSEAQLTRRVHAAGCKNVVNVLDWAPDPERQITRIIYEFAPYGNLYGIEEFYQMTNINPPEPFLWHIFHSIANAVCYNAYGNTDGTLKPGWVPIVHRDIKPDNILLAEPDPHSRSLYPTLKLADYGLAYSVPNDAVRKLKRALWSGGTRGFAAPEISRKIRSDPAQTPHPIASPTSDVYSIGCVLLGFIKLAWSFYDFHEQQILDLNFPFAYEYFPYSKALVDLARRCVNPDSRLRPSPKQLFDITLKHVITSYGPVGLAETSKPRLAGAAYPGLTLWNSDLQARFENNAVFRDSVTQLDWFTQNKNAMKRLHTASKRPGEELRPPNGQVAIGNGLGGFRDLEFFYEDYHHLHNSRWLGIMSVYDKAGGLIAEKGAQPCLRLLAQDRLNPAEPDERWRRYKVDPEKEYAKARLEKEEALRSLEESISFCHHQKAEQAAEGNLPVEPYEVPAQLDALLKFITRDLQSLKARERRRREQVITSSDTGRARVKKKALAKKVRKRNGLGWSSSSSG